MSLTWDSRRGHRGMSRFRIILAAVALAALLAARNVPPSFLITPSTHSQISAVSHHDQRPRFDRDGSQWSAVPDSVETSPPVVEAARFEQPAQPLFVLHAKGRHYNRPPPSAS